METESGHVKEYDDTPSAERITERHKSGTHYEYLLMVQRLRLSQEITTD